MYVGLNLFVIGLLEAVPSCLSRSSFIDKRVLVLFEWRVAVISLSPRTDSF